MSLFASLMRRLAEPRIHDQRSRAAGRRLPNAARLLGEALEQRAMLSITPTFVGTISLNVGANKNVSTAADNQLNPTISVDPTSPNRVYVASNPGTFAAISSNSGSSFTKYDGVSNLPGGSTGSNSSAWDTFGNLWVAYVNGAGNAIKLAYSHTGGQADSFIPVAEIDTGNVFEPSVSVGPGITPGTNSVWVTWNDNGTIKARGAEITGVGSVGTFTDEQSVPLSDLAGGRFSNLAIGPQGQVSVTFQSDTQIITSLDPDGLGPAPFGIMIAASDTNVSKSKTIPAAPTAGINAGAQVAYDNAEGSPFFGRLYLIYTDATLPVSNDTKIYSRFSDDNGATWSTRVNVSQDPGSNSKFFPRMAIDPDTGIVAVSWYDARYDTGQNDGTDDTNTVANNEVNQVAAVSVNGGASFVGHARVTPKASNAAGTAGADFGKYTGMAFVGGVFRPAWPDNSNSTSDNPDGAGSKLDVYTSAIRVQSNGGQVINVVGDTDYANQDDTITVRLDPSRTFIQFWLNAPTSGVPTFTAPLGSVKQINVSGLGGNDTLVVDATNGLVAVPSGIRYDGGTGFDALRLTETVSDNVETSDTLALGATPGAGRSTIVGRTGTQVVDFQNLEPVIDNVPAATFNITSVAGLASLLQAANTISYEPGQTLPTGGRVTVDNFEPIEFENKTALVIDAGAGADNVVLDNANLPTGLTTITVNGGGGDDTITALNVPDSGLTTFLSVTLNGGAGKDTLDAGAITVTTPFTLDGGTGDDTLTGGAGIDSYLGRAGDDTFVNSRGADVLDGAEGFDTFLIRGTSAADSIDLLQLAPTATPGNNYQLSRTVNGNFNIVAVTVTGALAPNDVSARPTVELVRVEAGTGADVIRVGHADEFTDDDLTNGLATHMLPFSVDGGGGNTADRLIVRDEGTGDLVLVRQSAVPGSGAVTVAPAFNTTLDDVVYENIERVDVLPIDPVTGGTGTTLDGRVVVFQADPFEMNDNRLVSTDFTDLATTHLNPTIDPGSRLSPFHEETPLPGDEDWYVYDANKSTTLRFDVRFDTIANVPSGRKGLPGDGKLDAAVYDAAGVLVASGVPVAGFGSQVALAVQAGQRYYLRVKGAALLDNSVAINTYTVGISNLDTIGPVVTSVKITGSDFNLFDPKGVMTSPTPLVNGLSIGILDLPARTAGFLYPALSLPGTVTEIEANNSLATAQKVDQFFNLTQDPNIGNQVINTSTTIPHTTVQGTGNGTFDYYSFTIGAAGTTAIFDIDGANNAGLSVDTQIFLYDLAGNLLDSADNSPIAFGALGSTSINDPYLEFTFATPGTYVIGVARAGSTGSFGGITGNPLLAGDVYDLQISIPGHPILLNAGLFQVVGDRNGVIAIKQVEFVPDPIVVGQPATGTINITFVQPLPDDRFTLTILDALTDPAGNKLDGESNASQPLSIPTFPSGNGFAGGNFVARFTVDSRPEVGVYSGKSVTVDINGNGNFDPVNGDVTNQDLIFQFGEVSDQRFAGKLSPTLLPGFDVLAAYGRFNGTYRFLIDANGNGRNDAGESIVSPLQTSALAVSGNFDGNAANGDEIALFDGSVFHILNNALNAVVADINTGIQGYPIAGDFDGDGKSDIGTYRNGNFYLSLALGINSFNGPWVIPFSSPGLLNRPVAADMDGDGITDIGLWIPYSGVGQGAGDFRFLISADLPVTGVPPKRILGTVNTLNHAFSPVPLGVDIAFHFGESTSLPIVGNFDPPTAVPSAATTPKPPVVTPPVITVPPVITTPPVTPPVQQPPSTGSDGVTTQGTTTYTTLQAQTLVASLYHDILGRAVDPTGLASYTSQLLAGATKQSVAQSLLTSAERYGNVVDGFYATYLHRKADPLGRTQWIQALQQGSTEDQVATSFMLSNEYAAMHASNNDFIEALYNDILGRGSDVGGKASHVAQMAAGQTRAAAIASFLSSYENESRVVDRLYSQILHRRADSYGMQLYTTKLKNGELNQRTLAQELLASDEYFAKAYGQL